MKRTITYILCLLALCACNIKIDPALPGMSEDEISVTPVNGKMTTKANLDWPAINGTTFPTGRTFVLSAYHNALTGSSGNYFSYTSFSRRTSGATSGKWGATASPKYWPLSGTLDFFAYSYDGLTIGAPTYPANVSTGATIAVPNNRDQQTDILHASAQTQSKNVAGIGMEFKHAQAVLVFKAKTNIARNTTTNYGITINSITVKNAYYSGTLAMTSTAGANGYCQWTNLGSQGDKVVPQATAYDLPTDAYGPSDTFGIGTYGLLVPEQNQTSFIINYTLHNGKDNSNAIVDNTMDYLYTCSGTWQEGKKYIYNIDITLDEILVNPTVTNWADQTATEVPIPPVSIAGLQIAPGPLYYNGTSYEIKDGWNYSSFNSKYGKTSGSTYFNFIEMGQLFEKAGFSTSDGDITNELDPLDGWRLPTQSEWASICGTTRAGSSVNGSAGKHYALVKLTGVTHAGSSTPNGLLIFPDGATITGKALSGMDNTTQTTGVTLEELNAYLTQGCAFLPASGLYYGGDDWYDGGDYGYYWSSTEYDEYNACNLYFYGDYLYPDDVGNESDIYYSVRLVKSI